jgi:hypothetical protein
VIDHTRLYAQIQVEPAPVAGLSPDMQSALKNGSYVIIIFFFVVFLFTRKDISNFTVSHLQMMKTLTDSNETHKENTERLVTSVDRTSRANIILAKILATKFDVDINSINDD